jgi:hypothetical protein
VTCIILKQGVPEPLYEITKTIGVASGLEATYSFFLTLDEPGEYTYYLVWRDQQYFPLAENETISITEGQ